MKRTMLVLVLLVGAASLFAQQGPAPNADPFGGAGGGRPDGRGPEGRGPGGFGMPQVPWKAGVSVLQEYRSLTGVLTFDKGQVGVLKADGVEYQVFLGRDVTSRLQVKSGDTVSVEGVATTVKGAGEVKPTFQLLKATVGGKTVNFRQPGPGFGGDDLD